MTLVVKIACIIVSMALLGLGCSPQNDTVPRALRHFDAGQSHLSENKNAEALAQFEQSVLVLEQAVHQELELPADVLGNWGVALHHLGRSDEAKAKYEAALELDPEHYSANKELGQLLIRDASQDARARGIRLLRQALKNRPGNPGVLYNLGLAYLHEDRFLEAYNLIQRAIEATGSSAPTFKDQEKNLAAAKAGLPHTAATPDMPNVLMIIIDSLRADHLGSYGYARNTTPNLDSVARQGVRFENAISQAPWTAPSVASLFTGLYPSVHGLDGGISWGPGKETAGGNLPFAIQKALSSGQLTLAEALRQGGYRTAGFVSNVYVNSILGFSQGFEVFNDEHEDYMNNVAMAKRRAGDTNAHAFSWLEEKLEEPFFLMVHYNDAHWPYIPPSPYGIEYIESYDGDLAPRDTGVVVKKKGKPLTNLGPGDLAYIVGLYDGEIAYMDHNLGKLLERIDSLDLKRDFLTVITADHGEEFLDHGSSSHGYTLYDELIRVPMILRYPGRLKAVDIKTQVRLIDVMPTILELVGISIATELQGRSLVPLLDGQEGPGPADALSEATLGEPMKSLRSDNGQKLIYSASDDDMMLFDLNNDPKEQVSLIRKNPSLAESLKAKLDRWVEVNQAERTALHGEEQPAQEVVLNAEIQERLKALGYIE
jgi:arylsulfatase A-like enzyme